VGETLAAYRSIGAPTEPVLLGSDDAHFWLNLFGSQLVGPRHGRYVVGLEPLASMAPHVVAVALAPTFERHLVRALNRKAP
jgi:hypothetical protein